jgi:hypothetical protein
VSGIVKGSPWVLLQLSWFLAARPCDVRRLEPRNIDVGEEPDENNTVTIRALFKAGKGAHFWGPYTIHSRLPLPVAKAVIEYMRKIPPAQELCKKKHQLVLAAQMKLLPEHSILSIRRGSLVHYARCGASDSNLQLLSGHRHRDTLMRYLGWGFASSEAEQAAKERSDLAAGKDKETRPGPRGGAEQRKPMWMGFHSGFNGRKGRRIEAPPELIPKRPPSNKDLGITLVEHQGRAGRMHWKLHVKHHVGCINLERLIEITEDPELKENLRKAIKWVKSPEHYGVTWEPLVPSQVPYCSFETPHVIEMLKGNIPKLQPIKSSLTDGVDPTQLPSIVNENIQPLGSDTEIRCAAKGFPTEQWTKEAYRPTDCLRTAEQLGHRQVGPARPPLPLQARTTTSGGQGEVHDRV